MQVHVDRPSSKRVGEQIASELCSWFVIMKQKRGMYILLSPFLLFCHYLFFIFPSFILRITLFLFKYVKNFIRSVNFVWNT